ncbi:MAG: flavodoxin domain-containing protein [Acidimicrobiales bacterium]|nr:flavodoxin domain-containing protein [Acidimicrobiales bacterium]
MDASIIYESMTGTTKLAASLIADNLYRYGVESTVFPITAYNPDEVAKADLVIVGSWTDGFLVVGQRPGRAKRFDALPDLSGKRAAVYCTYAINPGKTLEKLSAVVAGHGAEVIGGMALHRKRLSTEASEFADRLMSVVRA